MELDFDKICRVCMNEGVLMSIFKVHISKKIMSCSSVQVWQNDGLPTHICNKCVAKLHISYQFKKQCEKSDQKLRQIIHEKKKQAEKQNEQQEIEAQQQQQEEVSINIQHHQQPTENVYLECGPQVDILQEQHYEAVIPPVSIAAPLAQINYNLQPQNQLSISGYALQQINEVQVYSGSYAMPMISQHMPPGSIIQGQVLTTPMASIQPQITIQTLPQAQPIPPSSLPQPTPPQPPLQQQQLQQQSLIHKDNTLHPLTKPNHISDPKTDRAKSPAQESTSPTANSKQCPVCGKTFATTTKRNRHLKSHVTPTDLPHKCKYCGKAFAHSGNYKVHLRMHTDERPFSCTVCGKGCRQAQDLEKHMRTHTGERPHKCNRCPKSFTTSSNLIAHIRTHTGERPYVCCVCQKAFCQSNELSKHMRTHTGEKTHKCSVCGKEFNGSSSLIVHMRSHSGERPYVCSVCKKAFAQSSCLALHVRRHNKQRAFKCPQCDRSFVTASDLKDHQYSHGGEKPYACGICAKTFTRAADLAKHAVVHGDSGGRQLSEGENEDEVVGDEEGKGDEGSKEGVCLIWD